MPPWAIKRRMRKRLAMVSPGEKADCGVGGCEVRGGVAVPEPCSTRLMLGVGRVDDESRVCWLGSSSGGLRGESSVGMGVVSEGDYATRERKRSGRRARVRRRKIRSKV